MHAFVESLVAWEQELFLLLNSPHTPFLDGVMFLISDKLPWIVFLVAFLVIISYRQRPKEVFLFVFYLLLLVLLADSLSSGIIKPIFQRERPTYHPLTADLVQTVLGHRSGFYGFISGHATNFLAFATFSSLVIRYRWYTIIAFLTTLTVAYSRIYLGVHFITDVVPGIICGVLVGLLCYWLYRESRITFLNVPISAAKQCYLEPSSRRVTLTWAMSAFYVILWLAGWLLLRFYY